MKQASLKLIWLGYGCAILSLFADGHGMDSLIAIALGVAGFAIGVFATLRARKLNGTAIIAISIIFAYLGATGFRQGLVEGFEQGYQASRHTTQGQQ